MHMELLSALNHVFLKDYFSLLTHYIESLLKVLPNEVRHYNLNYFFSFLLWKNQTA